MSLVKIACPHCGFSKDVEQAKIPAGTSTIKCPKCQQSFALGAPQAPTPRQNMPQPPPPPPNRMASPPANPARPRSNGAAAPQTKFCSACGAGMYPNANICGECGTKIVAPGQTLRKTVLLLLAFFTGGIGGHKFYVKKPLQGVLYILFCWTGIPGLIAFVEFILYIFRDEAELRDDYPEVASAAVIVICSIFFGIFYLGILAAIAIPQFAAYRDKAYSLVVNNDLQKCNDQVISIYTQYRVLPTASGQLECQASPDVALYYFALGPEAYKLVGFHGQGQKAYLYISGEPGLSEMTRAEMEQQIGDMYGSDALERTFHFIE